MPTDKPQPSAAPLFELTWSADKDGRTTTFAFRVGFPAIAGLALLLGSHVEFAKRALKAFAIACGLSP